MRRTLTYVTILSAVSSALGIWNTYSQPESRDESALLSCLKDKGLHAIAQSNPEYANASTPFNLRYAQMSYTSVQNR